MMTTSPSSALTFVQMNMWDGRLYYPLVNFFDRVKPDILSAQEALSGPQDISPSYLTTETMVKKGYFDHVSLGKPLHGITIRNNPYPDHCAVLSKGNIAHRAVESIHLDPEGLNSEAARPRSEYFNLLHVMLDLPDGRHLHVLNHHGVLVYEKRKGSDITDRNFQKIADYAAALSGPVILSGDFNLHKDASSLQFLKNMGLKNLNDIHNVTVARNEFSWKPDEAVSHIFINDHIMVEDYTVAQDNVSDHLPLVMKFSLR